MPVRRRRVYEEVEELVDSPSSGQNTVPPDSLVPSGESLPELRRPTGVPSDQADYDDEINSGRRGWPYAGSQEKIGRTWADVTAPFYRQPQFLLTAWYVVAFVITAGQFHAIGDIWRPLSTGTVFNLVWYGGKYVFDSVKQRKLKEQKEKAENKASTS